VNQNVGNRHKLPIVGLSIHPKRRKTKGRRKVSGKSKSCSYRKNTENATKSDVSEGMEAMT
jgi:hypothetical protein